VGVGSGSGIIYDGRGDIVTNAHVVAGAQTLTVTLSTGKTYTARLVGTDTADDLAYEWAGCGITASLPRRCSGPRR
jgi:putative serine protease PepD